MTVEELQKACAALSEAWVKAMEPLKKIGGGVEFYFRTNRAE